MFTIPVECKLTEVWGSLCSRFKIRVPLLAEVTAAEYFDREDRERRQEMSTVQRVVGGGQGAGGAGFV